MKSIGHQHTSRPFSQAYLDRVYQLPNPNRTMEEFQRLHHHDLDEVALDEAALMRERRCVQRRLDYEHDRWIKAWLEERLEAIDRERGVRRPTSPSTSTRHPERPRQLASGTPTIFEYRGGKVVQR